MSAVPASSNETREERYDRMLSEMHTAILGNEKFGQPGLVKRMADVESTVREHDRKIYLWSTIATAAGVALTSVKEKILGP